jgi:tetratricopeptide (TPR) repeat protein
MQAMPVVSAPSSQPDNRNTSPAPIAPETPVVQTSVQHPVRKVDAERTAAVPKEFTRHMQLAERYFEKGAYHHAAQMYALALAYCPYEPRVHLGHSHASLAAGQYDASAASLARALGLDSRYVLTKVDMVDLVGGPDAFLARFNDLNEAVQSREAPMLQLLLAYICYQMDRPVEARAAIEAAQKILPVSVAIDKLKAAIVP